MVCAPYRSIVWQYSLEKYSEGLLVLSGRLPSRRLMQSSRRLRAVAVNQTLSANRRLRCVEYLCCLHAALFSYGDLDWGLSSSHYPRNTVRSGSPSSPISSFDYAHWANFAEMRAPLRITAASHLRTSASDWYPTLACFRYHQSYSAIWWCIMELEFMTTVQRLQWPQFYRKAGLQIHRGKKRWQE